VHTKIVFFSNSLTLKKTKRKVTKINKFVADRIVMRLIGTLNTLNTQAG